MREIVILPSENEIENEFCFRRCTYVYKEKNLESISKILYFKFPASIKVPDSNDCDSYLLAIILEAMMENRKIIVKGSVSRELLSNLVEFQGGWHKWVPEKYHIVPIEVDEIREDAKPANGAICAFSGGVDGTYSVWTHSQKLNGYRSQKINYTVFIHGFDIPLRCIEEYRNAFQKSKRTLDDVNIDLFPLETNFRNISKVSWDDGHGIALVAALNNFKHMAGRCIIGSSKPYDKIIIPYGSTPILDHFMGSDEFKIIHDGATHNRLEKVDAIADWKVGVKNLRVCWEGKNKDENCGECEKCIRTKLNFLVNNHPIPACFSNNGEIDFSRIMLKNEAVREEWRHILEVARQNKVDKDLINNIRNTLRRKNLRERAFPKESFHGIITRKFYKRIIRFRKIQSIPAG